ncbi:hypothetical protein C8R47DRAFT_260833 [Mycena vitilis]|nr:hypothetical protein C8R47DRAFT_260833 [Mycena vitilis]
MQTEQDLDPQSTTGRWDHFGRGRQGGQCKIMQWSGNNGGRRCSALRTVAGLGARVCVLLRLWGWSSRKLDGDRYLGDFYTFRPLPKLATRAHDRPRRCLDVEKINVAQTSPVEALDLGLVLVTAPPFVGSADVSLRATSWQRCFTLAILTPIFPAVPRKDASASCPLLCTPASSTDVSLPTADKRWLPAAWIPPQRTCPSARSPLFWPTHGARGQTGPYSLHSADSGAGWVPVHVRQTKPRA